MGKFYPSISKAHQDFIEKQHLFFVGTAPLRDDGRVNVSPKGLDSFRVISKQTVAYMDLISSGNETSAHTLENGRITFMFCSFDKTPNILRLYGKGFTILPNSPLWDEYAPHFNLISSTRQIIVGNIDLVQTSCGYGVPMYDYQGERDIYFTWSEQMGAEKMEEYMLENNMKSLDGLPTDLAKEKLK
ncbi:pyridoxamine 5'-phosphate oxidase family protein [Aquirufa rosea]|uniref:Pyridoxamine 5'-phosphate oxidase family protein n=1 Tax=Aquirufa rosea TaxID=2509241 RepID=A0A4Q1BZ59_9BACT|nr:pyridoxamine 5'-phosphate oxidase family protein [Aquirufa rosea]RXK48781.1 pyridoxamine 5'-phosphate oxidase family protein [Aquirufa rosea]